MKLLIIILILLFIINIYYIFRQLFKYINTTEKYLEVDFTNALIEGIILLVILFKVLLDSEFYNIYCFNL